MNAVASHGNTTPTHAAERAERAARAAREEPRRTTARVVTGRVYKRENISDGLRLDRTHGAQFRHWRNGAPSTTLLT